MIRAPTVASVRAASLAAAVPLNDAALVAMWTRLYARLITTAHKGQTFQDLQSLCIALAEVDRLRGRDRLAGLGDKVLASLEVTL